MPSALWREEMAAGGARRALAQAQTGLGTMVSLSALPWVLDGSITGNGPTSRSERYAWLDAGNTPYTITLPGGAKIPYNKVEPFGMTLSSLADTVELMKYANEDDNSAMAASIALGVGHAMLNKTYMEQWSNLIDAMQDPNQNGAKFIDQLAASFAVPAAVSGLDRMFDDNMRSHQGLLETVASRTVGVSNLLPPLRNVWGDPIKKETGVLGGFGRFVMPYDLELPKDVDPIDKWAWDNRDAAPNSELGRIGFSPPARILHIEDARQDLNIKLNTDQYDRYRRLSGNELKMQYGDQMLGAKDALNGLVSGNNPDETLQAQFNSRSKAAQYLMLLSIQNAYKKAAGAEMQRSDADIQGRIDAGRRARAMQLAPPSMGAGP
jgi:hypothetical protein